MQRLVVRARRHRGTVSLCAVFLLLTPTWLAGEGWVPRAIPTLFFLPLLARRRFPRTVAVLAVAATAVQYLTEVWAHDRGRGELAIAVALFTLVRLGDRRFGALITACLLALYAFWAVVWGPDTAGPVVAVAGALPLPVTAWALGEFARARRELAEEEELRARLAVSEAAAQARAAAAEERTRIARELHDVLAHSMSVIVLNADGARIARHRDPEVVDRTLATIGATGREALAELRRLLEVLHAGKAARSPQPTLTDLRTLVEQTGRAIDLAVTGEPDGLPAAAALHAYRIVQEAVTNMVKHAPADASGRVAIDFAPHRIAIEVTNTGGHAPAARLPSSGRGLTGMAQRVALYHGELTTGPLPGGGYRVTATLVLDPPGRGRPAGTGRPEPPAVSRSTAPGRNRRTGS
ncbi:histidine kinase [Amycolatopsis sp. NPDC051102]|uniref:sensor histidine kinase n=1 Tax=Amycolatopsis sp. NPDC051102 TaxID=3155163 RepID=UPI00342052F3